MANTGVLLVAYGAPRVLDDVEAFLFEESDGDVSEEMVATERLKLLTVGGRSPLHAGCTGMAVLLERRLSGLPAEDLPGDPSVEALGLGGDPVPESSGRVLAGEGVPVEVGMLHGLPTLSDALTGLRARGADRVVQVTLSPFESAEASAERRGAVASAVTDAGLESVEAPGYSDQESFINVIADACLAAREEITLGVRTLLLFGARSASSRGIGGGTDQAKLNETASRVAEACGFGPATVGGGGLIGVDAPGGGAAETAWVVAGITAGGGRPGMLDVVDAASRSSFGAVVVCPIGFVGEQLDTFYEVDVLTAERAYEHDMEFARARVPGPEPSMIDVLEEAARAVL